jgi:hypothetical protein
VNYRKRPRNLRRARLMSPDGRRFVWFRKHEVDALLAAGWRRADGTGGNSG